MPSARACSSASSRNGSVATAPAGIPSRSSLTMSCTLHDVQEPQSARPSTARWPRLAMRRMSAGSAGLEKVSFAPREAAAALGLGGPGEDLLRPAERRGPGPAQAPLDAVEELVAPALRDVQQHDA